ncbi:MAG: maleate cis-trans isomerase [Ornithinimicrobium sp.]
MAAVGLLYPGLSAADDYRHAEDMLTDDPQGAVRFPVGVTSVGEDAHRVDALLDLGSTSRLVQGADELLGKDSRGPGAHDPIGAVVWACTSGSFVFGLDGARAQVAQLQRHTGLPTSSTSLAFVNATHDLKVTRVAVAASYPEDVAACFTDLLGRCGITVTSLSSHGIETAAEVGTLGLDSVSAMVRATDRRDAGAVLVPDTAMHTLAGLRRLEEEAGMPVLTANQVTVWEGLRLLGRRPHLPGLGSLTAQQVSR